MTPVLRRWLSVAAIALLSLAATITTIGHDFTYDDRGVVLDNPNVHSLAHLPHRFVETYWPPKYGGDGYRPVVISLFALEWGMAGGAPWVFHVVNIGLAAATAAAVFWCASALLPPLGAFVAGALFAVHPVHVEVTGNVVGQSELIVALCLALAIGLYVRARQRAEHLSRRQLRTIAGLYALALFTKEHAIVLPGLLGIAELVVLPGRGLMRRVSAARPLALALVLVTVVYLFARGHVQADLAGFIPYPIFRFLRMTTADRIGTMMNEMPRIAQLLVFPTHLSADYSPNDIAIAKGFDVSEIPGIFICAGCLTLAIALVRRAPVVSYGLLWLIVAYLPVSNLLVPAGFVTAERTLFFPSIGVVLVAGGIAEYLAAHGTARSKGLALGTLAVLLVAGLGRSISRQRVWKNNDTFFDALMQDAPNGYRAHFLFARHVGLKSRLTQMETEYRRAIRIFPYDASVTVAVADAYTRINLCAPAVTLFEWSFTVEPEAGDGRYQYVYCLARLGRWADAEREARIGLSLVPPRDSKLMRSALRESRRQLRLAK